MLFRAFTDGCVNRRQGVCAFPIRTINSDGSISFFCAIDDEVFLGRNW